MIVRVIPRPQWPAFLAQFSRAHRAWPATIDDGDAPVERANAVVHPLRSVTPFVSNDRVVHIDIRFQDDAHGPLRVTAPGSVRVDETTEGIAQALEIVDSKGVATRVCFRAASMADGMEANHVFTAIDPED